MGRRGASPMSQFGKPIEQLTREWEDLFGGPVYVDPYHQCLRFPDACRRGAVETLDAGALGELFVATERLVVLAINVAGDLPGPHIESMEGTIVLDPDGWGPPAPALREVRYALHAGDMSWHALSRYDAVCPALGVAVCRRHRWELHAGPQHAAFFDPILTA